MKTLSKKILTVCLALATAVVMAVPAFAQETKQRNVASSTIVPNYSYRIAGWNGSVDSNGDMRVLTGMGTNEITRTALQTPKGLWTFLTSPHNSSQYYIRNVSTNEVVNIYRVLQNGTYYYCKGYWYDNNSQGRDQRVVVDGARIRLAAPLVSGTWYLQTDHSSVSDSDVIFYTDGNRSQAQWYLSDNRYD